MNTKLISIFTFIAVIFYIYVEHLKQNMKYTNNEYYVRTLDELSLAINANPNKRSTYEKRFKIFSNLHNYDRALDDLNKLISLDSTHPNSHDYA